MLEREELYEIYAVRWLSVFIFKYVIQIEQIAFAYHITQQIFC